MSVKFGFHLSDDDTERLFAIKEGKGKDNLTGNEFAKELLSSELYRLHPKRVRYDETGNMIKE